jgi:hypothetical protein
MTPYERTLEVLIELDELLTQFDKTKSYKTQRKIVSILRWINAELDVPTLFRVFTSQWFENKEAIEALLKEKHFNPKALDT